MVTSYYAVGAWVLRLQKGEGVHGEVGKFTYVHGAEHMVAAVFSCKMALVGSGWDNFCHHCTNGLRKRHSRLVSTSFLVRKVVFWLRILYM